MIRADDEMQRSGHELKCNGMDTIGLEPDSIGMKKKRHSNARAAIQRKIPGITPKQK